MKQALKAFFKDFFKKNRNEFLWHSFWRLFSCAQALFWPFAFSKIINILAENPNNWQKTLPWIIVMIANEVGDDFIRLRSKFGLHKLAVRLKINLVRFFTRETGVREGVKTGEAIQAVRQAGEVVQNMSIFYKDKLLQLLVNFVAIPIILLTSELSYFILLIVYIALYLFVDYFAAAFYTKEVRDSFKASKTFWGTVYRKTPGVWREREDGVSFKKIIDKQAAKFYKEESEAQNIHYWRWVAIQALSSMFYGAAIALVIYKIVHYHAQAGDLVLVIGYFMQTQTSLNIVSDAVKHVSDAHIAFDELDEAVEEK